MADRSELPYETYERLTGKKWTGGLSASVKSLYKQFGITAPAGSEQANNELQRALKKAASTSLPSNARLPDASLSIKGGGGPNAKMVAPPANMLKHTFKEFDQAYANLGQQTGKSMLDRMPELAPEQQSALRGAKDFVDYGTAATGALVGGALAASSTIPGTAIPIFAFGVGSAPGKRLTEQGADFFSKTLLDSEAARRKAGVSLEYVVELLERYFAQPLK